MVTESGVFVRTKLITPRLDLNCKLVWWQYPVPSSAPVGFLSKLLEIVTRLQLQQKTYQEEAYSNLKTTVVKGYRKWKRCRGYNKLVISTGRIASCNSAAVSIACTADAFPPWKCTFRQAISFLQVVLSVVLCLVVLLKEATVHSSLSRTT